MKKWMKNFRTFIAVVTFFCFAFVSGTTFAQNMNKQQKRENKAFDKSTQITRTPVQKQLPTSLAKAVRAGPIVKIATPQTGLATIMSEDFEGEFPTGSWSVTGGSYTWAKRNCAAKNGNFSAWAIGGGANGSVLACGANYPDNVDTRMVFGPFDLSDANWAAVKFFVMINAESNADYFQFLASDDGTNFGGYAFTGEFSGSWIPLTFVLTAVPNNSGGFDNFTGKSQVWIAFDFESDAQNNRPDGAFLDDIILQKGNVNAPVVVSSFASPGSSPRGLAFDGANLWCADATNDLIYKLTTSGSEMTSFTAPGPISTGLTWDGANLWNTDNNTDRIYKMTTAGTVLTSFATPGSVPTGLTYDGSNLWLSDLSVPTLWQLDTSGSILNTISVVEGTFHYGLAYDGQNLWLADVESLLIYKLDTAGNVLDRFLAPATNPTGLAWDGAHLWTADRNTDMIYQLEVGGGPQVAHDLGVTSIDVPGTIQIGSAQEIKISIKNFGTEVEGNFPVQYQIDADPAVTETYTGSLLADSVGSYIFSVPWTSGATGSHTIAARTVLPTDENTTNDRKTATIQVLANHDVGIVKAIAPPIVRIGQSATIEVEIKNFGFTSQANFPVSYRIAGEAQVDESFAGALASGQTARHTFAKKWTPAAAGSYSLGAWTALANDQNAANDSLPSPLAISVMPPESPGELIWQSDLRTGQKCPAIGDDGTIYVGGDGFFFAVSPDGQKIWEHNFNADRFRSYAYTAPAIGPDGTVYFGRELTLYAFHPDGAVKWKFNTGGKIYSAPAIGKDGTICFGSVDKNVYAINPDGSEKWRYTAGDAIYADPSIGPFGTVYIGCNDKNLYALNPDGTLKWKFLTNWEIDAAPAIGADGTIYIGLYLHFYAINLDGTLKWDYRVGDDIYESAAIGPDGTIYVGADGENKLHAINPDGSRKWTFSTGDNIRSSPAVGSDGVIYFSSWDRNVYAVNPDGTLQWKYRIQTGGSPRSDPTIAADGTIYIPYYGLYAFASSSAGLADTPWPKFHQNAQNTGILILPESDVGVSGLQISALVNGGNAKQIKATITNFGTAAKSNFQVYYQIENKIPVSETFAATIQPFASEAFVFSTPWTPTGVGEFEIKAYTGLTGDEKAANDTTKTTFNVIYDVGVTKIHTPAFVPVASDQQIKVSIHNFGSEIINNLPLSYQVNNESPVTETFANTIAAGDSVEYTFSKSWRAASLGVHTIKAFTGYPTDGDSTNNASVKTIKVVYPNDIGVSAISLPNTVGVNHAWTIKAQITNFGSNSQGNFPVSYQINSGAPVTENYSGTLAPQATTTMSFSQPWTPAALGSYNLTVRTHLNGDQAVGNDGAQKTIEVADFVYAGTWRGQTSQNRNIFFSINTKDEIDSLAFELVITFQSFPRRISCTYLLGSSNNVPIVGDGFEIPVRTLGAGILYETTVRGKFTSPTTCEGTIYGFTAGGGICDGSVIMGNIGVGEKTWSVSGVPVSVEEPEPIPTDFRLLQNYPNPFNPLTAIRYQLSAISKVDLTIYDQLGREVVTLVSQRQPAGHYEMLWDGLDHSGKPAPSGIYLYRLRAGAFIQTRKMLLIR